jgi:hypothetical protein
LAYSVLSLGKTDEAPHICRYQANAAATIIGTSFYGKENRSAGGSGGVTGEVYLDARRCAAGFLY